MIGLGVELGAVVAVVVAGSVVGRGNTHEQAELSLGALLEHGVA